MPATVEDLTTKGIPSASLNHPADLPANVLEGQPIIHHIHYQSGNVNMTNNQGFSDIVTPTNIASGGKMYIMGKLASAADAAASGTTGVVDYWTFVFDASAVDLQASFRIAGAAGSGTAGVEVAAAHSTAAADPQVVNGITTLGTVSDPDRLLLVFIDSNGGISPMSFPGGMTEMYDSLVGVRGFGAAWQYVPAGTATGTRSIDIAGSFPSNKAMLAIESSVSTVDGPLAPSTEISRVNLSGLLSAVQDSPDSPDANWLTGPQSN